MDTSEFQDFVKIPRLNRECIVTEKIDGTNAQIFIDETGLVIRAGSRSRWLTPQEDNYGFAKWVDQHREKLLDMGPGRHFGEWWGSGIQRKYGKIGGEKYLSLFNTSRWKTCCSEAPGLTALPAVQGLGVVPILYRGPFRTDAIEACVEGLRREGSVVAPGFMKPEGVVIYHLHAGQFFKVTLVKDELPKSLVDNVQEA